MIICTLVCTRPRAPSVINRLLSVFYEKLLVRSGGLEPPRVLPHSDLNAARLPIPPRPLLMAHPQPFTVAESTCEEPSVRINSEIRVLRKKYY